MIAKFSVLDKTFISTLHSKAQGTLRKMEKKNFSRQEIGNTRASKYHFLDLGRYINTCVCTQTHHTTHTWNNNYNKAQGKIGIFYLQ